MEEKVVIASVLRQFKLQSTQCWDDLNLMGELIMRPDNGVYVTINKRE